MIDPQIVASAVIRDRESQQLREPARMRGHDGEWGAVKARDSRSTQAVEAKSKFMRFAPAQVQVNGSKCEYLVCFDRCLALLVCFR